MARRLSERQIAFISAYTGEARGVGTEAARIAGYSGDARALEVRARECMRNPRVAAAIAAADREVATERAGTVEEMQALITSIARDTGECTKVRLKAAVELCKMRGAYITKVEVTGAGGGPIETRQRLPVGDLADATLADLEAALLKRAGES